MKARNKVLIFLFALVYFFGCSVQGVKYDQSSYLDVSPAEARRKIEKDRNVLILDVRTVEEFSSELQAEKITYLMSNFNGNGHAFESVATITNSPNSEAFAYAS